MRMSRNAFSAVVITSLLLGSVAFPAITSADELQDSQQQLQQLQQNQQQQKQHIQQLQAQEHSIADQIQTIENNLQVTESKIANLEAELSKTEQQIANLKDQISKTEKRLQEQNDLLMKRIRVMYENGSISYLDVILSSTSFSDFLDRIFALSMIAEQDKKILDEVKKDREQLQTQQEQLLAEQKQQKAAYNELAALRQMQQQQKSQKETALAQVHNERVKEEQELQQEQQAMNEIAARVQAMLAQQSGSQAGGDSGGQSSSGGSSSGWIWPVPSSHVISSGYGPRAGGFHKGIDIAAPIGTPIVAVADGTVLFAGPASGFGHWVVILHSGGVMSVYGHMYGNELYVSAGQKVKAGQQIAAVGSDGESSGPHLHFAVATGISGGSMNYVNPWNYLK